MKILQVLPALEQGGVERGTLEIAAALAARGIPNAVASAGGRLVRELDALGVRHYRLDLATKHPWRIRRNGARLAEIAADGGFTLMHVRSRAPAWSVRRASRLSGVPFIATWHGLYGLSPRWLKLRYNRVMLSGLRTIAVSDCVREHILREYGADPAKVVRIWRGADVGRFRPDAVAPDAVAARKARLGFDPGQPVISLPGRLTWWKGQRELLQAVARMRRAPVGVLFVGSDQGRSAYTQELRALAAQLRAEAKVVFLEHASDMECIYALSDVVVSASSAQPEAFGRIIPEAQAMGRIVVGTAHGGACETIRPGETGLLVPPGDPAALAQALDDALAMAPAERERIANAAVESVRRNFSVDSMCEATIGLYTEIHHEYYGKH